MIDWSEKGAWIDYTFRRDYDYVVAAQWGPFPRQAKRHVDNLMLKSCLSGKKIGVPGIYETSKSHGYWIVIRDFKGLPTKDPLLEYKIMQTLIVRVSG